MSLPHTPCSPSQRSRLATDITADAGALLPHPFTPYPLARAGLLSVAAYVIHPLRDRCPRFLFRGVAFCQKLALLAGEESGSSSS
jgi:hypothetical protein